MMLQPTPPTGLRQVQLRSTAKGRRSRCFQGTTRFTILVILAAVGTPLVKEAAAAARGVELKGVLLPVKSAAEDKSVCCQSTGRHVEFQFKKLLQATASEPPPATPPPSDSSSSPPPPPAKSAAVEPPAAAAKSPPVEPPAAAAKSPPVEPPAAAAQSPPAAGLSPPAAAQSPPQAEPLPPPPPSPPPPPKKKGKAQSPPPPPPASDSPPVPKPQHRSNQAALPAALGTVGAVLLVVAIGAVVWFFFPQWLKFPCRSAKEMRNPNSSSERNWPPGTKEGHSSRKPTEVQPPPSVVTQQRGRMNEDARKAMLSLEDAGRSLVWKALKQPQHTDYWQLATGASLQPQLDGGERALQEFACRHLIWKWLAATMWQDSSEGAQLLQQVGLLPGPFKLPTPQPDTGNLHDSTGNQPALDPLLFSPSHKKAAADRYERCRVRLQNPSPEAAAALQQFGESALADLLRLPPDVESDWHDEVAGFVEVAIHTRLTVGMVEPAARLMVSGASNEPSGSMHTPINHTIHRVHRGVVLPLMPSSTQQPPAGHVLFCYTPGVCVISPQGEVHREALLLTEKVIVVRGSQLTDMV